MVGTARCFATFLQDQLRASSRLFGTQTKALFESCQADRFGRQLPMTLGWHVGEAHGLSYLFKQGGGGGFRSEMRLYRQAAAGSVVMVNSAQFSTARLLDHIDRAFFMR